MVVPTDLVHYSSSILMFIYQIVKELNLYCVLLVIHLKISLESIVPIKVLHLLEDQLSIHIKYLYLTTAVAKVDLTGFIRSKFASNLYKIIIASFSIDSEVSLNWYFNESVIELTSPIYQVMRDGLRTVLKIQQKIQDLYGKLSVVMEKSEIKDVNYIPIKEKGLLVPVIRVFAEILMKFTYSIVYPELYCKIIVLIYLMWCFNKNI